MHGSEVYAVGRFSVRSHPIDSWRLDETRKVSDNHIEALKTKVANLSSENRYLLSLFNRFKRTIPEFYAVAFSLPRDLTMEVCRISPVYRLQIEGLSVQNTLSGRVNDYCPCDSRGGSPAPVQFGLTIAFFRYKGEPTSIPSALSM